MWFIKKSEILACLPVDNLCDVLKIFSNHEPVKKKTIIYQPGESSEYIYLLKKGKVRLMRLAENGNQITLSILFDGMIFGEGDVLNEDQYSHYAETLDTSLICYIHKEDFKELLKKYPEINAKILHILYRRWKEAQQQIEGLALYDVRFRLANLLLRFSKEFGKPFQKNNLVGTLVDMKISQDELANMIGASRESVNRILKEMRSEDFLDLQGRRIVLKKLFFDNFSYLRESS